MDIGLLFCDFALTRFDNLHYISNLRDDVHCNAIWHRLCMKIFILT